MKITRTMSFPNPVLTPLADDYLSSNLEFSCGIAESAADGSIDISLRFTQDDKSLQEQMINNNMRTTLNVVCLQTYFNEIFPFSPQGDQLLIPGGKLRGRTVLRALLVVAEPVGSFSSKSFHHEYGGRKFDLARGAVAGLSEDIVVNVGREKLAAMESIFEISKDDTLGDGQIGVDLGSSTIDIKAPVKLFNSIQALRNNNRNRPLVMNSVYLPAVMQVLNALSGETGAYEGKRWFRIFSAKCDHLGIDLQRSDVLADAQRLLNSPLGLLSRYAEVIDGA